MGGEILMNSMVARMLVHNRTACGVEIQTGPVRARFTKRVQADVGISNADLLLTLERLIGAEHLEHGSLESIRKLRPTYPCFLTHTGLKHLPAGILLKTQG